MTDEDIRAALRDVLDPEVGVNIVDLGLIYDIAVGAGGTRIALTMTTPACPLGETLVRNVTDALQRCGAPQPVKVELVWDPPWSSARMSAQAKRQLGWPD